MCNAWNHLPGCTCGWGGENHMSFGALKSKNGDYHWTLTRSFCTPTQCKYCSKEIYFIHHNGGCACFESLGYPWPKHACYDNQVFAPRDRDTTQLIYKELISASKSSDTDKPILGVIGTVKYANERHFEVYVVSEVDEYKLYIPSNVLARDIIGSIVFLYRENKELFFLHGKRKIEFRKSI